MSPCVGYSVTAKRSLCPRMGQVGLRDTKGLPKTAQPKRPCREELSYTVSGAGHSEFAPVEELLSITKADDKDNKLMGSKCLCRVRNILKHFAYIFIHPGGGRTIRGGAPETPSTVALPHPPSWSSPRGSASPSAGPPPCLTPPSIMDHCLRICLPLEHLQGAEPCSLCCQHLAESWHKVGAHEMLAKQLITTVWL